jgi:hypothetical protein
MRNKVWVWRKAKGVFLRAGTVRSLLERDMTNSSSPLRMRLKFEIQAGVPTAGLIKDVENGPHYATSASAASVAFWLVCASVCSASTCFVSIAERMRAEVF